MSGIVALGLLAAIAAAVLYGSAPVAQAVAAKHTAAGAGLGLGLMLRLVRRRMWLLGLGLEIGAFVLEAYAFSAAPATLVAPVMACDIVVFVLIARVVFDTRLSSLGIAGAVTMGLGVGLLALAFRDDSTLGEPAGNAALLAFLGACVGVCALGALVGGRLLRGKRTVAGAAVFSVAAGIAYGFATMATRQIGRTFSGSHPWELLATPTPYLLVVSSVLALSMMQRGLQLSPVLAFPVTSVCSAFLPVILSVTLLGDPAPTGAGRVAFVAALFALLAGVFLVARDRSRSEAATETQVAEPAAKVVG